MSEPLGGMPLVGRSPDEDGTQYFARQDLYRYICAEQRVRIALQNLGLRDRATRIWELEFQEARRRYEASLAAASVERAALDRERQSAEQALAELRAEISRVYHVDFERCTFDDETGRIREIQP